MTEIMDNELPRRGTKARLQSPIIIATAALLFGATCGLIYGRRSSTELQSNRNGSAMKEIVVSKEQGLVFKSEDGTPLLKIGQDSWGTYVHLLGSDGKPLVELNNLRDKGAIVVGSKAGGFAYMQAQENSGTITLIGKYGKEAVQITSATSDGGGNLSINEGTKGYQAVGIDAGPNKIKSKGTITIPSENGSRWEAP